MAETRRWQAVQALATTLLQLRRGLDHFSHSALQFLLNDVCFVSLHFFPPCAFLPRAATAKTPAVGTGKLTNIDARTFAFLHSQKPIVNDQRVNNLYVC
jgi:hypothetical protein